VPKILVTQKNSEILTKYLLEHWILHNFA